MQQVRTGSRIRTWPTPQDYNEAVQNLHINVQDPELKIGEVETSPLGLPRPITGSFASVYKIVSAQRQWALRCFLRDIPDTQWRYGRIADYLKQHPLPYTVQFEFQFQGIQIAGRWYPILKMDWVEGQTLDNYLREQLSGGSINANLCQTFKAMCIDLKSSGIAHGDLQHGNIMVRDGKFYLVDYDGMFVPHINAPHSNELGHRNYQHPGRTARHFGDYLDNFSAWVIYVSLKAMAIDTSLSERLGAGEDCLLFRKEDFVNPLRSPAFAALEKHENEQLRVLAKFIRWQLTLPLEKVPALDVEPHSFESLPAIANDVPVDRSGPGRSSSAALRPPLGTPAGTGKGSGISGSAGCQPASDPWEEDADYKQYLSEAHYAETGANAHPQITISAVKNVPEQPVAIPAALFKRAPRPIQLNDACGRISPVTLTMIAIVAFMPLCAFFSAAVPVHHGHGSPMSAPLSFTMLAWVLSLIYIWWHPVEHRKLIRNGTAVRGKVISKDVKHWIEFIETRRTEIARQRHKCTLVYQYPRSVNGHIENVKATVTLPDEQFRMLDDDEEIVVVHDEHNNSVIYKLSYYKAI